jgi:hypothetical protein
VLSWQRLVVCKSANLNSKAVKIQGLNDYILISQPV